MKKTLALFLFIALTLSFLAAEAQQIQQPPGSSSSGGSGTVTAVSVTTSNGVSGTVANATTTPAIALTLGAINPTSVGATTSGTAIFSTVTAATANDTTVNYTNALGTTETVTTENATTVNFTNAIGITATATTVNLNGALSFTNTTATAPTTGLYSTATGTLTMKVGAKTALGVSTSGWVGINTTTPVAQLDIEGENASTGNILYLSASDSNATGLTINNSAGGGTGWNWGVGGSGGGAPGCSSFYNTGSQYSGMVLCSLNSTTDVLSVLQGGVFGWNTSTEYGSNSYDTGLSRASAGVIAAGNGTFGNASGSFNAVKFNASQAFAITTTTATVPTTGMYSAGSGSLNLSTTGVSQLAISNAGAIFMPNLASSSAAQTGTVCWATGGNLTVDTTVGCLTSTRENKEQILSFQGGLAEVMKFKPVSFYYKDKALDPSEELGLIAEDVVEVEPRLVGYGSDGKIRGVRYEQLTSVLVSAIQEQQKEIDEIPAIENDPCRSFDWLGRELFCQ